MKYRQLGRTGLTVSRVCLGTMTFGAKDWGCDEATAHRLLDRFADAGGNFIDTANNYAGGASEEILGRWLKGRNRDDFVVATKCLFRQRPTPNARGLSRKHVIEAVHASLRRLGTDYIDLQFVHGPDPITPLEETLRAFDDLVRAGSIRYLGCSNLMAWRFVKANGIADRLGLHRFSCGQYLYNLINRDCERDVLPACTEEGMGFVAWSPLAGGMLTGKYQGQNSPPAGTRAAHRSGIDGPRFWHERGWRVAAELQALAASAQIPAERLALGWVLANRAISAVIIGARTEDQLAANLWPADQDLAAEHLSRLAELSAFDLGHLAQFAAHARKNFPELEF